MQPKANDIIKTLKNRGLRVTPQRFGVYANLLAREDHPTVDQILRDLNQEAPTSSQATVYAALQALREAGLVREVLLQEGVSRYDANVAPHHHFRCNCCGAIEDINWNTFPNIDVSQLRQGLKVERYEVTVEGMCDACGTHV